MTLSRASLFQPSTNAPTSAGKVVDIFLRYWPGHMALVCPVYAQAFETPDDRWPVYASDSGPDL